MAAAVNCARRRGQASVNPKADTVEDLQGRRKLLHMSMATLAEGDLHRQVAKIDEVVQVSGGVW